MIWKFSDGTTVELGGKVEGATILAQELRETLRFPGLRVDIWPPPSSSVPLDVNDPAILDAWLRAELKDRKARGIKLMRPDNVPPLPPPPWSTADHVPGRVY